MNKNVNTKPLIAIVGPTASGKTDLAIKIAKAVNGVIISADSRQIYKGLSIGTNQPKGKVGKFLNEPVLFVNKIPHFFIANFLPNIKYSVVIYQKAVYKLLPKLWHKGFTPILCGGTGLYISSVIQNYQFPQSKPDYQLRKQLEKLSLRQLLNKLKKADTKAFSKIDKKNRRRVIRAIEIALNPQLRKVSDRTNFALGEVLVLGLQVDRPKLYKKINKRVDAMLKAGLLNEVKWLLKNYPRSPALATIGYQELAPIIKNNGDLKTAVELIKQHTRNFAKRQVTWFKKTPNIVWIKSQQALKLAQKYIKAQISS